MDRGIACGRVLTVAVESRKMATILQMIGWQTRAACSLGLPCTFLTYDIMLWSIDTCQIKLSADQYYMTMSLA